jgi:hypothetical protein
MLKVLVFNDAVTPYDDAGIAWTRREALASGNWQNLQADDDLGIVDHDVFVVALASLVRYRVDAATQARMRDGISEMIGARVASGGSLVCFLDSQVLDWLPVWDALPRERQPQTRPFSGCDIRTDGRLGMELLARALEVEPEFQVELLNLTSLPYWNSIAWAKDGAAVAGTYKPGRGKVFLLPPLLKTRQTVTRLLLDKVIPDVLPDLAVARRRATTTENAPAWIAEVDVPGASVMVQETEALKVQIDTLRTSLEAKAGEHAERLRYRDLLWSSGFELEDLVRDSLQLLGIETKPQPPMDLVYKDEAGRTLYIEVEGSEGPTTLKKGQQLLSYIANAEDPASVSGAVIANPYRKSPHDRRPPEGAQAGLFVDQLKALAAKQRWSLLTTSQIFEWVCRDLAGDATAAQEARKALGIS